MYELATVFGSPPHDPAAAARIRHGGGRLNSGTPPCPSGAPSRPEPEDVFLALTSYPPGDEAPEAELVRLRREIAEAFQDGNGVLEVEKESALFISRRSSG